MTELKNKEKLEGTLPKGVSIKSASLKSGPLMDVSDDTLMRLLYFSVSEERKITAKVIKLLAEIDRRKIYLKRGYGSLLEFCIKELKYSESSAYRRISAMRVCRDIPQVKNKIQSGALSLSVISQAQSFIRKEEKEKGQPLRMQSKAALLEELENKSSRETEQILIKKSPHQKRSEKLRHLTPETSELRLTLSQETLRKLERIKNLRSHKNTGATYSELIDEMSDIVLQKIDPLSKPLKRKATPTRNSFAETKRQVWRKARGQCSYRDLKTKRRCASRFQLQIDHIVPRSKGGLDHLENLQLLCREHNQFKSDSCGKR